MTFTTPKHFDLEEFLKSERARTEKVDNTPSWNILEHIIEFSQVLDDIREEYGNPIYISSGYRCPKLNKILKGAAQSGHMYGWCADLQVDGDLREFANFVYDYLKSNNILWDELLFESAGKNEWLHFAYKGQGGRQRKKRFDIIK